VQPKEDEVDPVRIYVSMDMVKDVKDLKYAQDGESTYEE